MKLKSSNRNPGKQTLRLALYQSQSFSSLSLILLSSSILLLFNNGKSDYSFFEIFCFILTTKGYWYLSNLCETASQCCKGVEWMRSYMCVSMYRYIHVCVSECILLMVVSDWLRSDVKEGRGVQDIPCTGLPRQSFPRRQRSPLSRGSYGSEETELATLPAPGSGYHADCLHQWFVDGPDTVSKVESHYPFKLITVAAQDCFLLTFLASELTMHLTLKK